MESLIEEEARGHPPDQLDLAYRKVDGMLRAYGMRNTWVRHRLARELVRESLGDKVDACLEQRAATRAQERIAVWLSGLADVSGLVEAHGRVETMRLAVKATRLCERWPEAFLEPEPAPEILEVLKRYRVEIAPPLERSTLGPTALEFGTAESVAEGARSAVQRWPILRNILFYGSMLLVAFIIYYLAR